MKKLTIVASFFIALAVTAFGLAKPAQAVDLTVTCDGSDCVMTPNPSDPLFTEGDVKPGDTYDRTITVTNTGDEDCALLLETKNEVDPNAFGDVLFTNLNDLILNYFGASLAGQATGDKNLTDLFAAGPIALGLVGAGGDTNVYHWLVSIDTSVGNEYQKKRVDFDFDLHFTCGEPGPGPELFITKDNDQKGKTLGVGAVVTYEITVKNTGSGISHNTQVIDVQPIGDYFDYLEGSGKLTCTPDGPTNEPITASGTNPYIWDLGTMDPEELCTLNYQLKILSTNIPGTHHNIAVARGQDDAGGTIFSNVVDDPFEIGISGEVSGGFKPGEVLGAAIGQVLGAATGSKTFWLILALVMIGGSFLLSRVRKSTLKSLAVFALPWFVVGMSLISAPPVQAADTEPPVVKIVQLPSSMDTHDFEISYTALDGGEAGLASVHLEFKKDGGSWQDLGTFSEVANKVSLSGKITDDGKYFFKATACDHYGNCAVSETSTTVDSGQPSPPQDFHQEKTGGNTYKITWHNPDADDLAWVYIYRSDESEFTADDGTKIASVAVTKNTNSEYIDTVPDSSKTYYYALRAVDSAGNASDLVGGSVIIAQAAPAGTVVTGEGAVAGQVPTAVSGEGAGGGAPGAGAGTILGVEEPEATEAASPSPLPQVSPMPSALGETLAKLAWYHWLALAATGSFLIFLIRFFMIKNSDR